MGRKKEQLFNKKNLCTLLTQLIILIVSSFLMSFFTEFVSRTGILSTFIWISTHLLQFLNATVFIILTFIILFLIIRKLHIAFLINSIIFISFAEINFLKTAIRNEPLFPWDFKILNEAISTALFVKFPVSKEIVISLILLLVIFIVMKSLNKKISLKLNINVFICFALSIITFAIGVLFSKTFFLSNDYLNKHSIEENQWSQIDGYRENGFISSFMMNLAYINVKKPEDYNKKNIQSIVSQIKKTDNSNDKPNIILILNESFSDISLMKNVDFKDEIMPTINYLKENYISGYALTPQFGGGTCNSEFEVLTGFTMANLPLGSTPYQQYILKPTPSYVSYLKDIGYSTIAIHSFGRNFWNRDSVFKNIGFDIFFAEDNFINPEMKRGYISDLEVSKEIIKQYEENKSTNKPFFNFSITMQNHASYGENNYPADYRVNLDTTSVDIATKNSLITYATGIRDADASLKYLMDYFSKVNEKTVIVFFGDHLAELGDSINSYIKLEYEDAQKSKQENIRRLYSPPFVVWNNYNNLHLPSENLSMYQLLPFVTKELNLPKPLFFDYLSEQANYFKGFAQNVYLNNLGNPVETISDEAMSYFDIQKLLQYDLMFGNKYANSLFQK